MFTPQRIQQLTHELSPELIELRRDFHRHPELAFEEHRTAGVIEDYSSEYDIGHTRVAKTGVLGILKGAQPGKTIMLRADMDALPIQELGDGSYRSINEGVMHACGHGAMPAETVDATMVAAQLVVALQAVISREIPPQEFGVITVGSLHSGTAGNVISGEAELELTIRSFDQSLRQFLEQRVQDVAQSIATTFRAAAAVDYSLGYPVLINDVAMTERVRESAQKMIGAEQVTNIPAITGSEDFAYLYWIFWRNDSKLF